MGEVPMRTTDRGAIGRWSVLVAGLIALVGLIGVTAAVRGSEIGGNEPTSDVAGRAEAALHRAGLQGATVSEVDGVLTVSGVDAEGSSRLPDILAGVEGAKDFEIGSMDDSGESAKGSARDATRAPADNATDVDGNPLPTDRFLDTPRTPAKQPEVPLPKGVARMGVFQGGKMFLVGKVRSYLDGNRRITAAQRVLGPDNVFNDYSLDASSPESDDGVVIVAEPFIFPVYSSELPKSFQPLADTGVAVMTAYPSTRMRITGYTDSSGDPAENQRLSKARAEALKDYIVSKGVAAKRIRTKGLGSADPAFPNNTPANRAKNRRIEVSLDNLLAA